MLSAANTHDSKLFEPLLETNPAVRGRVAPGRSRRRHDKLHADKGYDYRRCREYLHRRGIKVRIARRGIEDKSKLGRIRWVVERTMCAARRSVVSPVQPGGIWREVPGSNG